MEIAQRFDNVSHWLEVLRVAEQPEPRTSQTSRRLTSNEWAGTKSFEAALDLCERGWQKGLEQMHKLAVRLSDNIVKTLHIPEVTHDVVGDVLDIGRFVRGEPEDFMTLTPAEIEQEPRVLHVIVNTFISSGVSAEALFGKGAAICAMVDALEQHGKRIEIDAVCAAEGRGNAYSRTWVRVKDADAPLQMANLVFLLAHPSTFRRLIFGTWELLPVEQRRGMAADGGYYGRPGELRPDEDRGDIYIGCSSSYVQKGWGTDRAEQWVLAQLSEQGIHTTKEVGT